MKVDDPARELPGEGVLQDRVIAGADDQLHAVLLEHLRQREIARPPVRKASQAKHVVGNARFFREVDRRAVAVGAHHHDARGIERVLGGLDQYLQVAAPARDQDANPDPAHSRIWTRRCSDATMSPTTNTSPSRIRSAVAALASSTTTIIPMPILKVRHISSSGVKGAREEKMAGFGHGPR